ncbi:hypothetical protein WMY93_022391 [Mugilogobius chulae]|uniref:Ysc84 actin-binding domain-containing protein n=1 Tax=Mugilogobius chulae TaxID=88201 RepID=A0AAW0NJ56_9GOBI
MTTLRLSSMRLDVIPHTYAHKSGDVTRKLPDGAPRRHLCAVNNPLPSNLKSEAKKAAKILRDFTEISNRYGPDKLIPPHVIAKAEGLAIISVIKAGFMVTARGGSGIVIARLADRLWERWTDGEVERLSRSLCAAHESAAVAGVSKLEVHSRSHRREGWTVRREAGKATTKDKTGKDWAKSLHDLHVSITQMPGHPVTNIGAPVFTASSHERRLTEGQQDGPGKEEKPSGMSAPSAIGIAGLGGGFEIGVEVSDLVIILNQRSAIEAFSKGGNLTLGGNCTVAAGPIGRNVEADVALRSPAAVFTYCRSRGLFAGISIEGSYLHERKDANRKFYARDIRASAILNGDVDPPSECYDLYHILDEYTEAYTNDWTSKNPSVKIRAFDHITGCRKALTNRKDPEHQSSVSTTTKLQSDRTELFEFVSAIAPSRPAPPVKDPQTTSNRLHLQTLTNNSTGRLLQPNPPGLRTHFIPVSLFTNLTLLVTRYTPNYAGAASAAAPAPAWGGGGGSQAPLVVTATHPFAGQQPGDLSFALATASPSSPKPTLSTTGGKGRRPTAGPAYSRQLCLVLKEL